MALVDVVSPWWNTLAVRLTPRAPFDWQAFAVGGMAVSLVDMASALVLPYSLPTALVLFVVSGFVTGWGAAAWYQYSKAHEVRA